jgi:hypothetical protein
MTLPRSHRSSRSAVVPTRDERMMRLIHVGLAASAATCTLAAVAGNFVR